MCPRAKVLQAHPAHPVAVVQLAASACPGWDDVLWHVLGMVGMLGMGKRYVGVLSGPGILGGHYKTTVACPMFLGRVVVLGPAIHRDNAAPTSQHSTAGAAPRFLHSSKDGTYELRMEISYWWCQWHPIDFCKRWRFHAPMAHYKPSTWKHCVTSFKMLQVHQLTPRTPLVTPLGMAGRYLGDGSKIWHPYMAGENKDLFTSYFGKNRTRWWLINVNYMVFGHRFLPWHNPTHLAWWGLNMWSWKKPNSSEVGV